MKQASLSLICWKGQIGKHFPKESANLSGRNLQGEKWFRAWSYERYFSLNTETIQSQKWFNSEKAKKPNSVLWIRKHIFSCPQNMDDT